MRLVEIGIVVATVLVPATEGLRVEPPNFSGAWTYDSDHSHKPSQRWIALTNPEGGVLPVDIDDPSEPPLGNELRIKQDPKNLTLEVALRQLSLVNGVRPDSYADGPVVRYSMVYRLDGSESRNEIPPSVGDPARVTLSTATWNGGVLMVIVRPQGANGPTRTYSFRLDDEGRLIVDTTNLLTVRTSVTAYTKKPA